MSQDLFVSQDASTAKLDRTEGTSQELFVGREREKELYKKFLSKPAPWVLIITGLGGIGKTTLLHALKNFTARESIFSDTSVVIIDFAKEKYRKYALNILEELTGKTAPYCDVQKINQELRQDIRKNFDQLTQLANQRTKNDINESEDLALQEIRHQMRELATQDLYLQLDTYKLRRLVIMLDTCEWLNEPEGIEVGQWVLNELIPGIHARVQQQDHQCSIVIASRLQPKLDVISAQEQRRLTLPMLDKNAVDQYMERVGMQDTSLRQYVFEITHGHALSVSLIAMIWESQDNKSLTVADLPAPLEAEFNERALVASMHQRVLASLKSPFQELTKYGVLLRKFDLPFLRAVFPDLLPEAEALDRFNQLIRYPYIESQGNYRYAFHELVRNVLAEEVRDKEPEKWKFYHERALEHLTKVSPNSPDWYYHDLAFNEKQGILDWQQAIQEARGRREQISTLLQATLDKTLKFGPAALAEIEYEQGRFNYYGAKWDEALTSYKEALASFKQVENYAGQAKVLQAMGDAQRALGEQENALTNYKEALSAFQQAGDQTGQARMLQAIGDMQRLRNEQDNALQSYEQALNLFRQVQDQPEVAKVLEAMGDVQQKANQLDLALRSYQQALVLYQEEQDQSKRARVLKAIGNVQRLRQDKNAALESYGQALALYGELKEPSEEARVRQAIENVQKPESDQTTLPESDGQPLQSNQLTRVAVAPSGTQPQSSLLDPQTYAPQAFAAPLPKPVRRRRSLLVGLIALFIVLVLFSSSFLYYIAVFHPAQLKVQAQATAKAQAQATAIARQNIYTQAINGVLVLEDPLSTNDINDWNDGLNKDGSGCMFKGGVYHVIMPQAGYFEYCSATNREFDNFAYQVQITIIKGDLGGIIFREDNSHSKFYYFSIGQDGSYKLYLSAGTNSTDSQTLLSGSSSKIHTGLGQTNLITAIANHNNLYLYVNQQYIASIVDNTLSSGQIGVVAENNTNPTQVTFRDAQVWTLNAQAKAQVNPQTYNQAMSGALVLNSSLDSNDSKNWDDNSVCTFRGGAYHVIEPQVGYFRHCSATNTAYDNFVYQVRMTIIKGNMGGILFRSDDANSKFYYFVIGQDGSYALYRYRGDTDSILLSGFTSKIRTGLGQSNLIAIVANNTNFYMYVNQQYIASISDHTYDTGEIGVVAQDNTDPTEVTFSDAQVWLPM